MVKVLVEEDALDVRVLDYVAGDSQKNSFYVYEAGTYANLQYYQFKSTTRDIFITTSQQKQVDGQPLTSGTVIMDADTINNTEKFKIASKWNFREDGK